MKPSVEASGSRRQNRAGHGRTQLLRNVDRRRLDFRIPLARRARRRSSFSSTSRRAGRVEEIAARRQQPDRGRETGLLRFREAGDRRRADAVADLGRLPERAGAAAGGVEEDAVEAAGRQRRRRDVGGDRDDLGNPEPAPVLLEQAQPRDRDVERQSPRAPSEEDRRERLASRRRGQVDERVPRRHQERQQLRSDVLDEEGALGEPARSQRVTAGDREAERRHGGRRGLDALGAQRLEERVAALPARVRQQVERRRRVVGFEDPPRRVRAESREPALDEEERVGEGAGERLGVAVRRRGGRRQQQDAAQHAVDELRGAFPAARPAPGSRPRRRRHSRERDRGGGSGTARPRGSRGASAPASRAGHG